MIEFKHLSKTFSTTSGAVNALEDISLHIAKGDIFGIIGMSGAGKSTLVRCINMLERPTAGTVVVDGQDMSALKPEQLREMRRKITMIFQGFNLLVQRTCLENVCFPLELAGMGKHKARARGLELLAMVGLPDKANAYPAQLSGGQQQRVAIARALATEPKVLLCDEATSALDPKTTHSILELVRDINRRLGITVVVITHQMSVVEEICHNVAILDGGKIAELGEVSTVFSSPRSQAARRLVFPDDMGELRESTERVFRLVFRGALAAGKPLITQMAMDEQIAANILYASTRCLGDKVYGNMLLGLPDDADILRRAQNYLCQKDNITLEEVVRDA